jgi:hypothetical protein
MQTNPFPKPRRATAKLDMIALFIMIKLFEQRIAVVKFML